MKTLPRLDFALLPTPIEPLPRLSAALGGPQVFVKRDDQTGLALGGNKTRKLEYLLAEARAQGARLVITAGAVQSNHCRQTAAAAARCGFTCKLVLTGEMPPTISGNLLLDGILGAEILWAGSDDREMVLQQTFEQAQEAGQRPYLIPYGGSNPTGASSYAFAIREMLDQDFDPDWIVFASSSGGTQAGLEVGARLFGSQSKVLGISVDEPEEMLKTRIASLAEQVADRLGEQITFDAEEIRVNADFIGPGYGVMTAKELEAIRLFARHEGLLLDPVYTGRAGAGLVDLVRKGYLTPDQRVLFWHTGGTPALFADKYRDLF